MCIRDRYDSSPLAPHRTTLPHFAHLHTLALQPTPFPTPFSHVLHAWHFPQPFLYNFCRHSYFVVRWASFPRIRPPEPPTSDAFNDTPGFWHFSQRLDFVSKYLLNFAQKWWRYWIWDGWAPKGSDYLCRHYNSLFKMWLYSVIKFLIKMIGLDWLDCTVKLWSLLYSAENLLCHILTKFVNRGPNLFDNFSIKISLGFLPYYRLRLWGFLALIV